MLRYPRYMLKPLSLKSFTNTIRWYFRPLDLIRRKTTAPAGYDTQMNPAMTKGFPKELSICDTCNNRKYYLFWFSNEHADFVRAELEALLDLFKIDKICLDESKFYGPLLILNVQDEADVHKILSRSVLIHDCIEIWASGSSLEEMHRNLKSNIDVAAPYAESSFRLRIENYGKKISQAAKLELIHTFDYVPLNGPIDLSNPSCSLHLVQYYGLDSVNIPEDPHVVFFGRWVGNGQRKLISKTSLKNRKFIGNTSMDALLSLLMVNLGHVRKDSLVLDPFVGTGSLLVAAAVMGGYVIGTDIDYLMLHAKTRPTKAFVTKRGADESIYANLKQYGVEDRYLDALVADASLPLWKDDVKFDAIITDPPYGVREAIEKIGTERERRSVPKEHLDKHYPQKVPYSLSDVFTDLLRFSAQRLVLGGHLVCWVPVARYDEEKLPQSPCFKLVTNCEQVLTAYCARRLLVFRKMREPNASLGLTHAVMDRTAPMYKLNFFQNPPDAGISKKERQWRSSNSKYGLPGQAMC